MMRSRENRIDSPRPGQATAAALLLALALTGCHESDAEVSTSAQAPEDAVDHVGGACGDAVCDPGAGESCSSCEADCGACPACAPRLPVLARTRSSDVATASAAPLAAGVDYASQIQPIFQARCTDCHGDADASAGLSLSSYAGASSVVTACDCAASILYQKVGPSPPFGARMPRGGPYLGAAETALICQWIDEGAAPAHDAAACGAPPGGGEGEVCDTCGDGLCGMTESCADCVADCGECGGDGGGGGGPDVTAPTFAGIEDVDDDEDAGSCSLSWVAATDDVTAAEKIHYLVFAGAEGSPIDFGTSVGDGIGVTTLTVSLPVGKAYDLAVRAVDEAGNRDTNDAVEDCDLD